MTPQEQAELKILNLASDEKNKFALEVTLRLEMEMQLAYERGLESEWYRLIDVCPIAVAPHVVMRIFRLTDAGLERREVLRAMADAAQVTNPQ